MCFLDSASPASPSLLAQWRHVVDKGPSDVMVARMGAWSTVHNWGLGGLADDVGLVVGELGTNAWMQGRPPIVLTLRLEAGCLTIEVSDMGPGMPMFTNPGLLGMQGRGLPAAAAVADEIGVVADTRGTTVWARLRFRMPEQDESDPGAVAA